MDKYAQRFINASILYLGIGLCAGMFMTLSDESVDIIRFVHVHLLLLGFVAMMIFGVAYHIIPRFNAQQLPFPSLVPLHFWLSNIALISMLTLYAMGAFYTHGNLRIVFGLFGFLEAVAIFLFIINIWFTINPKQRVEYVGDSTVEVQAKSNFQTNSVSDKSEVALNPTMTIAEIMGKYPQLSEKFADEGLEDAFDPNTVNTVGNIVTLAMIAKKVNIDVHSLIARLENTNLNSKQLENSISVQSSKEVGRQDIALKGELAKVTTLLGPLLKVYPETSKVIEKHCGSGCFTCPSFSNETLEQAANLHGVPVETLLDEVNQIISLNSPE